MILAASFKLRSCHPHLRRDVEYGVGPHLLGLKVDGVSTVFRADRDALKPAPMGEGKTPHIIGVCAAQGKMRLLLDVRALLE